MTHENPFVTVATFEHPNDAVVQLSLLESHGIEADLLDDNAAMLHRAISMCNGGVTLIVARDDAEQASRVLGGKAAELPEFEFTQDAIARASVAGECPNCASTSLIDPRQRAAVGALVAGSFCGALFLTTPYGPYGPLILFALLVISFYIGLYRLGPAWRCRACGARWEVR